MAGINFGQVLGGIGLVSGILGQQSAQRDARNARNQMTAASNAAAEKERAIAARLMEQFEQRNKIAQDAITSGVYDANRLVSRLDADFARNQARMLDNAAGAFRTMGYRPGDSEPGTRLQAAMQQGLNQRNQQAEQLRQQSPLMMLNLLSNAEGGILNRVAGMEGAAANRLFNLGANNYNMSMANQSDLGSLLGGIMPFLNRSQGNNALENTSSLPTKRKTAKGMVSVLTPNQAGSPQFA
jgi:hypothetical protein